MNWITDHEYSQCRIDHLTKEDKQLRKALKRFIKGLKHDPYYLGRGLYLDLRYAEKVLKEEK